MTIMVMDHGSDLSTFNNSDTDPKFYTLVPSNCVSQRQNSNDNILTEINRSNDEKQYRYVQF